MARESILQEISQERDHQNLQWGITHDNYLRLRDWIAFIIRYLGRASEESVDRKDFRDYMIKVASVAVAAIESLDRATEAYKKSE